VAKVYKRQMSSPDLSEKMKFKPIILIGFMGSGKSSVGKKLAKLLGIPFVDSDLAIENKTSKTINQIFEEEGEEKFRLLEKEFISEVDPDSSLVIATGGGMPCFHNNIGMLNQKGMTFYLQLDVDNIIIRTSSVTNRPLILQWKEQNLLREKISEKLFEREIFYKKAHHIIDANLSIPQIVTQIIQICST
jgi:shikimate kinase